MSKNTLDLEVPTRLTEEPNVNKLSKSARRRFRAKMTRLRLIDQGIVPAKSKSKTKSEDPTTKSDKVKVNKPKTMSSRSAKPRGQLEPEVKKARIVVNPEEKAKTTLAKINLHLEVYSAASALKKTDQISPDIKIE